MVGCHCHQGSRLLLSISILAFFFRVPPSAMGGVDCAAWSTRNSWSVLVGVLVLLSGSCGSGVDVLPKVPIPFLQQVRCPHPEDFTSSPVSCFLVGGEVTRFARCILRFVHLTMSFLGTISVSIFSSFRRCYGGETTTLDSITQRVCISHPVFSY